MTIRANHPFSAPDRDLVKREIENHDTRNRLIDEAEKQAPGEKLGIQCITIEPGDELGVLYLNTQFEARPEKYEDCQAGQNRIALLGSEWLRAFLEQLTNGAENPDYVVDIHTMPCPGSNTPPPTEHLIANLEGPGPSNSGSGGITIGPTVGPGNNPDVQS